MTDDAQLSKRERARKLIAGLLAKTVANGCTEDEAAKAAAKASELMQHYNVSAADAQEVRDDVYGANRKAYSSSTARKVRHHEVIEFCTGVIATFCECRAFQTTTDIVFFGQKHDTQIAHYLLDMFRTAAETQWQLFRRRGFGDTSIYGRKGFMRGFVVRTLERFTELIEARKAGTASTGTALVVVKQQVVTERYAIYVRDAKLNLRAKRAGTIGGSSENYAAGCNAAGRVNITTGVGGSSNGRIGG